MKEKQMKLAQVLKIQPGVTALIGGGGKTTMMKKLKEELSSRGTVIISTSTKILEPEDVPVLTDETEEEIRAAIEKHRVVCIGTRIDGGKLAAPKLGFDVLKERADFVIVEADGAHRLPIKAHAEYEPVIPKETKKTVLVIGADCFGQPIKKICHRPQRFARCAAVSEDEKITPAIAAKVIEKEGFGDLVFINKVETKELMEKSNIFAETVDLPVAAGSLKREEYLCLR